jgi:hypothetical protein
MRTWLLSSLILVVAGAAGAAPFQNLGFDNGRLNITERVPPPSGIGYGPSEDLLSGWRLLRGARELATVGYDILPPGFGFVTLVDTSFRTATQATTALPVDVRFSLALFPAGPEGGLLEPYTPYQLVQTGDVPPDAQSIRFFNYGGPFEVRVNGLPISLIYDHQSNPAFPALRMAEVVGDISAFAGETVELRFVTIDNPPGLGPISFDNVLNGIDSIRFSPEPIPEPSAWLLLGLGGVGLLAWHRRQRRPSS